MGAGDARDKRLLLAGTSHHAAPLELRERLYLDLPEARDLALRLADVGEAVVLATCNRTELYVATSDVDGARARVAAELTLRSGLPTVELAPLVYFATEEQVGRHLFRVAAGLDSQIVGEPQILGQLRDAHASAREAATLGPLLDRLLRHALHAGRRVRQETGIGERPASIATVAVELVRAAVGPLADRRVLIIGAGRMSELVAAGLVSAGAENVFVANRTLERARALAGRYGGRAVSFARLDAELARADVVVASTRCPRIVLTSAQVAEALPSRGGRPLVLVDIAVPRDLDPSIGELAGCQLYDIEDLSRATSEPDAAADPELARAKAIVDEEAARFDAWRSSLAIVPTIVALRRQAEAIRAAELARAHAALDALGPAERRAVEVVTAQLVHKLLHMPTVRAKEAAERHDGVDYEAALRHLFALEEVA